MKNILSFMTFFLLALWQPLEAQETTPVQDENWSFLLEPYLMFPNMDGTTGLGALPDVSVDASPGDIFEKLQIGFMLNAEATKGKWHVGTDLIYMKLKQDAEPGLVVANGEVTAKQFAWEVAGLYSITPWLDVGVGGLLNSLNLATDINVNAIGGGTNNRSRELSRTWLDPMLIARTGSKPGSKFIYRFRGEIGGFGIGSKFAWQLQAIAGYRFSKLFQLTGGYRFIGINYEKNNTAEGILNNNRFLYNVNTFGPEIRLGFNF
jgi:hypothetical protein